MIKRTGILLCGGVGSRLGQITKAIPKSLVPVYNKPLVDYQLELFKDMGIKDVVIITRPDTSELFKNYLYNYSDWTNHFVYIAVEEQPKPEGIAQAYVLARKFVPEGQSTVLGLGDNIFYFTNPNEKERFIDAVKTSDNMITTFKVQDPRPYGVVKYEDGKIVDVVEKPQDPPSNEIIPGLYFFDYSAFEKVKNLQPSSRGELEITDLQRLYIREGKLSAFKFESVFWYDCGTVEDLLDANNFMHIIGGR